jgi:thioredoxin reductase/Pyruvate/2-oxoacid:ferredoxin oxidoreductase delta subunit
MLSSGLFIAASLVLFGYYLQRTISREKRHASVLEERVSEGLVEPPSLHPVIIEDRCIGCGACIEACPEGEVLGLIEGRAKLIDASHCIGHGACKTSCPTNGIELVFGTATRGVDIPFVKPNFETNVPGIFIAGELGGMGLIRNAFEQGRQAVEAIRELAGIGKGGELLDLVVIGAGPAGLASSLTAKHHGLRFVTLEQDTLGGTIANYPRGKVVMTAPGNLPIIGEVRFTETTKEKLLEFFEEAERKAGLEVNYRERVEDIGRIAGGFEVRSSKRTYRTRAVLLTIGRRGTPRKLGVPGEDLEKVLYRLDDPAEFRGRKVLIVGGGDSALEAAASLAEQGDTHVTISYRSKAFNRAKQKNRLRVQGLVEEKRLQLLMGSSVQAIHPGHVDIEYLGKSRKLANHQVIVCAGGILPTPFLEKIGIEVETKFGEV